MNKATGNMLLFVKRFYASVIATELGLRNNSSTDSYAKIKSLFANHIINKNLSDLTTRFCIADILIENHQLPHMYWMLKLHKNPIKARFIIASSKSSIKSLSRTVTSIFRCFVDKYKHKMTNVGFLQALIFFGWYRRRNQVTNNQLMQLINLTNVGKQVLFQTPIFYITY